MKNNNELENFYYSKYEVDMELDPDIVGYHPLATDDGLASHVMDDDVAFYAAMCLGKASKCESIVRKRRIHKVHTLDDFE